jgi:RNA polymerase sigma factor (sigma-70 family)
MPSGSGTGVVRFIRGTAGTDGPPDAELVSRFALHSDEQAFRTLVARHAPVVWAVCRRMLRNHHDAEDAFQATFLVFARGAGGIRSGAAVGGWLCGVAGRVASRVRLKPRPESAAAEPTDGHPDGALGDLTVREAEAILYEELARLPAKYRDAVVLCCLEGLSRDEAAARLGWTENQVKNCLEQGRERLRSRLARRGIALGVPLLTTLLAPPATAAPPVLATEPPTAVSTLANGVTRTMWIAKWKWAAAACAALVLTAGGTIAAVLSQREEPPAPRPARPPLALVPSFEPVANAPEPKKEEARQPWEVATAYLQHIIDGKPEQALKLADAKKITDRKIKEMQVAGLKNVKVAMLLINDRQIDVVTVRQPLVRRPGAAAEDAHAVVTLEREKPGAPWVVRDNDVADVGAIWREVDDFLEGRMNFKDGGKAEPAKGAKEPAWAVAEEFLKLVLAKKDADALKLTVPGTISENKVGEIREAGYTSAKVAAVLIADRRIDVVFEGPREEKGVSRYLVLMLAPTKDGAWRVKDVDADDEKKLEELVRVHLAGAYNKHPEDQEPE